MYAIYTATRKAKTLTIADNVQGQNGTRHTVNGKREAIALAAEKGAKRWNF